MTGWRIDIRSDQASTGNADEQRDPSQHG
jgi:hypothetical protein